MKELGRDKGRSGQGKVGDEMRGEEKENFMLYSFVSLRATEVYQAVVSLIPGQAAIQ